MNFSQLALAALLLLRAFGASSVSLGTHVIVDVIPQQAGAVLAFERDRPQRPNRVTHIDGRLSSVDPDFLEIEVDDPAIVLYRVPRGAVSRMAVVTRASPGRKVAAVALGAAAGLAVSAAISLSVNLDFTHCHCENPNFYGAIWAVPLGTFGGAWLGNHLAKGRATPVDPNAPWVAAHSDLRVIPLRKGVGVAMALSF